MKKFTILIPIYNDWESLKILLSNINECIKNIKSAQFNCIIVNDCSTVINPKIKIPNKFSALADPLFNVSIDPTLIIQKGIKKGIRLI